MATIVKQNLGENLKKLYEAELQAMEREQLLNRLWAGDVSLWPSPEFGPDHARKNLEFLNISERLPQLTTGAMRANWEAEQEGLMNKLLISFGTVHHFCKAVLDIHPDGKTLQFVSLENCHPATIQNVEERVDLRKTFVALVNKSGYNLEDHALFLYFYNKLEGATTEPPGRHFAAACDPSSYLAKMALEYGFRYLLEMPPGILAPYCSILFLGLFLLAVPRVKPEVLRIACQDMKKQYADTRSIAENPVCELAAFLTAAAKSGRRLVNFLASPELEAFAEALCPLVGGSLGWEERGLFPLSNTLLRTNIVNERASSFVILRKAGAAGPEIEECVNLLRGKSVPFLEMTVADALDLLRHTYAWQIATALAGARMGIYPFKTPDTRMPLNLAVEMLNHFSPQKNTMERRARVREGTIQIFLEGRARHEVSQLNLAESLHSFFQHRESADYVSLFVFLERNEETQRLFGVLREQIAAKLGLPVLLGWGPRSVDTYAYFLREGVPQGLHLVVTGDMPFDVKVPGANYNFGQLYLALALGQFDALTSRKGLTLRLHLGSPSPTGLADLQNVVVQALKRAGP